MKTSRKLVVVAVTVALTTVSLSMALNVWAFTEHYPGVFGWVVGLLLPIWVLALCYAGKWGTESAERFRIGVAAYVLAAFLLVVSLPHLAHGFDRITGGLWWESWSLALVTDLTQVVMKLVVIAYAKETQQAHKPAQRSRAKPVKLAA